MESAAGSGAAVRGARFELLALRTELPQGRDSHGLHFAWAFETPALHFAVEPVDLRIVAQQCNRAILHGTYGSTATILLGGKPVLQLPISLEQHLVGQEAQRLGAVIVANRTRLPKSPQPFDNC